MSRPCRLPVRSSCRPPEPPCPAALARQFAADRVAARTPRSGWRSSSPRPKGLRSLLCSRDLSQKTHRTIPARDTPAARKTIPTHRAMFHRRFVDRCGGRWPGIFPLRSNPRRASARRLCRKLSFYRQWRSDDGIRRWSWFYRLARLPPRCIVGRRSHRWQLDRRLDQSRSQRGRRLACREGLRSDINLCGSRCVMRSRAPAVGQPRNLGRGAGEISRDV